PLLPVLLTAKPGPWIKYHNIVGQVPENWVNRVFDEQGDGVVSVESARLDDLPQVASQIVVPADHVSVHRHPQSILEVRRVLLEQLAELENLPYGTPSSGVQLVDRSAPDRTRLRTATAREPIPLDRKRPIPLP
ncbi:MAG: hypothetical protein AAF589_04120, partial [Planctomycetota bacterium]